jgi:Xaa-Pro dipeptidase
MCDGVAPPDADEHAAHRSAMQAALRAADLGALVVEPGPMMQYLSGVQWGRSERSFLLLLPAVGDPRFIVPAFEARRAAEQVGALPVETWQEHADPFAAVGRALRATRGRVALEAETRTFIVAGIAAHVGRRRIVDDSAAVASVRMRKTTAELSRLRRANEATKAALKVVSTLVRPGMKQSEVADLVRRAQTVAGLSDVWVLALAGPAAAFPHGTQTDRAVAAGELMLVDTGGALHGYRSDITRTWAVGTVAEPVRRAWETVLAAQTAALDVVRPGVRAGEVDAAARAVMAEAGFGAAYEQFTHRLGHGIGLQVHEAPYLVRDNELRLEAGMTMSNEPGIYVPGAFGVRLEDIVAVTEQGAEVFGPRARAWDEPFG